MTSLMTARSVYATSSVNTASPARLLLMLYDRLVLDLELGRAAIATRDRAETHERLTHAQAILMELRGSLDLTIWPEGSKLAALYTWMNSELIAANIGSDESRVAPVIPLVIELRDAWRQAALTVASAE
jgi:flagellar protein FliS